ncbi:MAG: MlaD family protein [Balneolaceae bacterium]
MSNELKIGLTVILAVFAAYIGFRYMSDIPVFRQTHEVVTTFERVDGLSSGNLVYMNGVKIGSVKNIELMPEGHVRVVMSIEADMDIPEDSRAQLTSLGVFDGKTIVIERGTSGTGVAFGGEIEGVYTDSVLEGLGERGHEIGDSAVESFSELNQFLNQLNNTLDDDSRQSIGRSIRHMETATAAISRTLAARQQELSDAISSAGRTMAQLDTMSTDNRPRIDSLMTNLEESSSELKKVSRELDSTVDQLNQILYKVNEGEGTIGRMVNDPSLYQNADSLSIELRNLIKEINENPGRYLRHMNLIEVF